jgi:ATP-dependent DNA helicase RecG
MQEKNNILKNPVRYLKGVGPKKSEQLSRLGIVTVEDLVFNLPMRYEDRSRLTPIRQLKIGEHQTIEGEIVSASSRIAKTGTKLFQAVITDGTGFIHAVWFNQPYLKDQIKPGVKIAAYGRVELFDKVQIVQPEYEIVEGSGPRPESLNMGRIVPVYSLTADLTQKYLRGLVHSALGSGARSLAERLPTYILARERLVDVKFAAQNIHFPTNFDNLERAYRRIVFEEFLMLQLALALRKRQIKTQDAGLSHRVEGELIDSFRRSLPFELTGGQKKAIADIERDMASSKPMNRLLEGDVGSGKTVVAAHALLLTVQNGFQGVIMAPTEVLARQHFISLSELMMPLGVNVTLLVSGIDPRMRQEIYAQIKDGSVNVVVGTHAVIQEAVAFNKLGLAVVDEQHKFGVTQRSVLKEKGYNPHVLVMTATPIPRTLALTVYGDLDMSVIRELPKGRKPITTYWIEESKRQEVYCFVREEIEKGRQAYVVCPMIEECQGSRSKAQGPAAAVAMFEKLKKEVFANFEVGLLHGRMESKEKAKVMNDFKKRKIDVLVSTVVIEVGIDVPNASVMLVENADRFGLSQLHQLRGRIGRGEHESYCILLADPKTEEAKKRLAAIEDTLDGFRIAEADLEIRGPGEFFGTRQHGLPEIRFGDIIKDIDIMESAKREAFGIAEKDPHLSQEHHRLLKEGLAERFRDKFDLAKVA